jgi:hypothetical protein
MLATGSGFTTIPINVVVLAHPTESVTVSVAVYGDPTAEYV